MKKIKVKNKLKQITCIILALMLCSFIIPNVTNAAEDEESGPVFAPFSKFLTFLCDNLMQFMQDTFTTTESIKQEDGTYNFQYSPAIIFSGTVQGLDINFINPNTDVRNINNYDSYIRVIEEEYYSEIMETGNSPYLVSEQEYNTYLQQAQQNEGYKTYYNNHVGLGSMSSTLCIFYEKNEGEKDFLCVEFFQITTFSDNSKAYSYKKVSNEITDAFIEEMNSTTTYSSIAFELQPIIATWYNALRKIALVGLLSVLVYIGIQVILTVMSGKETSKYKKMLIDWLIALCLVFTLHYLMSATLVITQKISSVLNNGETDNLLNTLRNEIEYGTTWEEVVSQVIMYVIMTILTVMFTFQYLKRVLYMGFFTMIAPLVTLTYPLDKIKDSKAQAFTIWIREYIFNALIQVVHLVVYYVLVGSALSLVEIYPLYGILAIGFISQGEKIIRKMFGFDNATTVGTMQAAAVGGLISAALNKLQKVSKPNKNTQNSNNNIRTVSGGTRPGGGTGSKSNPNIKEGAKSLAGRYYKQAGGAVLGTLTAIPTALLGFATGVAQGDVSAALTGAIAGGTAGKKLGQGIGNGINLGNIKKGANGIIDTFNEGAHGAEYAKNAREIREFKGSSTYQSLKSTYGDSLTDDKLSSMLQAGINEKKDMEKVLGSNNIDDAIGYYTLAKQCPEDIYYDDKKLQLYLQDLGLSQTDAQTMRKNMKAFR